MSQNNNCNLDEILELLDELILDWETNRSDAAYDGCQALEEFRDMLLENFDE